MNYRQGEKDDAKYKLNSGFIDKALEKAQSDIDEEQKVFESILKIRQLQHK